MLPKISHLSKIYFLILLLFLNIIHHSKSEPTTNGYTCTINSTTTNFPCQTYVLYRAKPPDFLDLASIGDIFNVSRLTISKPSNISNPSLSLLPNQPLFIPISCGCHPVQNQTLKSISFVNMTYTFKPRDNFYYVSTKIYGYLTTSQSTEIVNPNLDVHNLPVGGEYIFPIFCKCPNNTQLRNNVSFLVSYVFQPDDNLSSIASLFGVTRQSIVDVNGDNPKIFDTVFVPVSKLVKLNQPIQPPGAPNNQTNSGSNQTIVVNSKSDHKGAAVGLGVGMGVSILLLVLVSGVSIYREVDYRKKSKERDFEVINRQENVGNEKMILKQLEQNLLLADVSDTLDKYKIYEIDELRKATDGFDEKSVIYGSVYKGCIDGKFYAIKKMEWNAYEELKILQKVNHGNLVRLEGFSIDPEDATCYLVYEFIENGSLHFWLHKNKRKLNWKARLKISIDIANGLQYFHEHTRPQVVHKDIKSSNILLDANMRAKIANFGLARSGCNAITMHIVGTQGYIAPEYLTDGIASPKMDVFSFGVVLLELLSGREAIDVEGKVLWASAHETWDYIDETEKVKKLMEWIDKFLQTESCSVEALTNMMDVAVACVNKDHSKRPSMVDVVYVLCKSDDPFYDMSGTEFSTSSITSR
ncbi:serine/threonine receptor-like kinase NFP [Chenopodium quinoa]|uniref:serine/threonine receptor-like kinase NFP n=1 Tax=Chenopodium quinoa TaxID=63459 RepID=UPI000B778AC9|nr:serine/threonine receptor-like kinase NFP [Chenopodium quinoa]